MRRFSDEELRAVRNKIAMRDLICTTLEIPCKEVEGVFRFLCPKCGEFQTAINPKTNLSRCFRCQRNFNSIEIVMEDRKLNFVDAVKFLKQLFGKELQFEKVPPARPEVEISTLTIS